MIMMEVKLNFSITYEKNELRFFVHVTEFLCSFVCVHACLFPSLRTTDATGEVTSGTVININPTK